jgi:hypothetical protein
MFFIKQKQNWCIMFYISQDLSMLCPITTQPAKKKNQKDKKTLGGTVLVTRRTAI